MNFLHSHWNCYISFFSLSYLIQVKRVKKFSIQKIPQILLHREFDDARRNHIPFLSRNTSVQGVREKEYSVSTQPIAFRACIFQPRGKKKRKKNFYSSLFFCSNVKKRPRTLQSFALKNLKNGREKDRECRKKKSKKKKKNLVQYNLKRGIYFFFHERRCMG